MAKGININRSPEDVESFTNSIRALMSIEDEEVFIYELEKIFNGMLKDSGRQYLFDIEAVVNNIDYGEVSFKIERYGSKTKMLTLQTEVKKKYPSNDK